MRTKILPFLILLIIVSSCLEQPEIIDLPEEEVELTFPDGFNFKTSKEVNVTIQDNKQGVIYELSYAIDNHRQLLGKYNRLGRSTTINISIPSSVEEIEILQVSGSSTIPYYFQVPGNTLAIEADLNSNGARSEAFSVNNDCIDRLYAVESSNRGFWSIDLTTGNYNETVLPLLEGGGSIACALDQSEGLVFYNVGRTLYQYDVVSGAFSVAQEGNPFNGSYPRLTYYEGYFWMSNGTKLYKVDAVTNETVASYTVSGFVNNNSGGDLAFDSNGELYLACFSGLYKFDSFGVNTATLTRISAENFPFQLTSMAIDREDRIYVATNDGNSNLIEISKEDGSYQILKTYNHKINDLTAWRCSAEELSQQDSDNDGIIDELDDYPNDPDAAFDVYTPSALGMGTLAYEDLWPVQGDYDFNDLVIGYRFVNVMNSSNRSVRMEIELTIKAVGASEHSGFAIELPFNKTDIESVSGQSVNGSQIALEANGLEASQSKAVLVIFNDALDHVSANPGEAFVNTVDNENAAATKSFNIVVQFVSPIDASRMNEAPFNPFAFSSYNRGKEIHLSGMSPTDLADPTLFGTDDDDTNPILNKYYQNVDNMPWAINVIHNFRHPIEKARIDKAYNRFRDWGRSNGTSYRDWYGDNSGYRNLSKIYLRD
ncbi:LruC domain-containing protein [Roseivirga sp.]|uniref:LruC domain-containing protein n=1 Tax=Roseivirga sp. TaxID=1964215 RepID=UPI003B8BAA1E